MRVRAICCEIIFREACLVAANSPLVVDFDFLPKGLHDIGSEKMRARLQEAVDAVDPEVYDATVLGYALCNNGVVGLEATRTRLIVPRAHDCISFFLGSRQRYREYFDAHPGTYFRTTGWNERGSSREEDVIHDQLGTNRTYQEYVEKYGEDNAKYLMEFLGQWEQSYTHGALIDFDFTRFLELEKRVEEICKEKGWEFVRLEGQLQLIQDWLDGCWDDERFLRLRPGQRIEADYRGGIIRAVADKPAREGNDERDS